MGTPNETRVVVRRRLKASPNEVFECFSTPEALARWFYAGTATRCAAVSEFRVGGRYQLTMTGPGDDVSVHTGRWVEIVPDRRLRFTWSHASEHDSLVTMDLEPVGEETELTVRHDDLLPEMAELFETGWAQCLGYLARALADDRREDRAAT